MLFGVLCFGSFILVFGAVSAWLIYTYFQQRRKAGESIAWPATQGKIVVSTVKESVTRHDTDNGMWVERTTYYPEVRYEYSVLGKTYTGRRIAFGASKGFSTSAGAEKALERYPVRATVTVYYNPDNPADAVLEREMRGGASLLLIGIAFALATACLLFAGLIVLLPGK